MKVLVAGGGGFIGGHLVGSLLADGHEVRSVDDKPISVWHQVHDGADNRIVDVSLIDGARSAVDGCDHVYNLACDMGGMGFIELNKALCMLSVLMNTHLLKAAREFDVERYFFSSSACVYPARLQCGEYVTALRESDVYPADPEDGYGWEKLFSERLCRHFTEDFGLETRVARYHNVYGPRGTWDGGREKVPAAICRKVAIAKYTGAREIEVWGDGLQTRSFLYIDDCIEGTRRLMDSEVVEPLNIGSDRQVSVEELISIVEGVAGVTLERRHDLTAPQGVRGRSSDNTLVREQLVWQPSVSLEAGLAATYRWIESEVLTSL
jgi:GDP-D-mannose 3',5'-epimerase